MMETILIKNLFPAISNGHQIEKSINYLDSRIGVLDVAGNATGVHAFLKLYKNWFDKYEMERKIENFVVNTGTMIIEWKGTLQIKQNNKTKNHAISFNGLTKFNYVQKELKQILTYSNFKESLYSFFSTGQALATQSLRAHEPDLQYIFSTFTPRELEVIRGLANGYTFKQIAFKLSLSPRTIETYVYNIYFKSEASNKADFFEVLKNKGLWDYLTSSLS